MSIKYMYSAIDIFYISVIPAGIVLITQNPLTLNMVGITLVIGLVWLHSLLTGKTIDVDNSTEDKIIGVSVLRKTEVK